MIFLDNQVMNMTDENVFIQLDLVKNWLDKLKAFVNHPNRQFVIEKKKVLVAERWRLLNISDKSNEYLSLNEDVKKEIVRVKNAWKRANEEENRRAQGRANAWAFLKDTFFPKTSSQSESVSYNSERPCYTIYSKETNPIGGKVTFNIQCKDGDKELVFYYPNKKGSKYASGLVTWPFETFEDAVQNVCGCR